MKRILPLLILLLSFGCRPGPDPHGRGPDRHEQGQGPDENGPGPGGPEGDPDEHGPDHPEMMDTTGDARPVHKAADTVKANEALLLVVQAESKAKNDSLDDAIALQLQAVQLADEAKAFDLLCRVHLDLSDYYVKKEDYKSALEEHMLSKQYNDTLFSLDRENRITEIKKRYEDQQRRAAQQQEEEERNMRGRIITNTFIIGFICALIFLLIVFRQRNRISKEKKRSDELLLNILPAETAEELKKTGSAIAKEFPSVTVLFTDFKNFTSLSEQLTPQELVNEINFCFSAFDKIISGYKIEKIKTIGDAYMCAGGLPVANTTHAADVVRAAIEIRNFMRTEKAKRDAAGKPFFEIRIGCNTGTVVAGIVGIKKYAYDIWGDTVNIAARMESSGETGKINISGSTHDLVKDKFRCEYRGKVEAKNKGMIDMYFVEA